MDKRRVVGGVVALVLLVATARNGATEHAEALLLRVLAMGGALLLWPRTPRPLPRWAAWAMAAGLLAALLGLLLSPNRTLAVQATTSAALVVALCAALALAEEDWTGALGAAFVAVGLAHTLWAAGQSAFGALRGTGGFYNPNELAACLAPLVILCAFGGRERRWLFGIAALLGLGIIASGSRSGLAATGLGLLTLTALSGRRVLAGAVALAVVLVLLIPGSRLLDTSDPYSFARLAIWRESALLGAENMPFGVGLNHFGEAMRQHGVPVAGLVHFPKTADDAHNELLNAWVELGFPGAAAVAFAPLVLAWALWTRRRDITSARDLAILVALAVPACAGDTLHVPVLALGAAVWAANVMRQGTALNIMVPRRVMHGLLMIVAPLLLLCAARAAANTLSQRTQDARRSAEERLADATWARRLAPGSLGIAMQYERLRLATGTPALDVVEAFVDLGDHFTYSPRPLNAAADLLSRQAAPDRQDQWEIIAKLRAEAAARDPQNALAWHSLALAQSLAGDDKASEATLEHAVSIEPYCARALVDLALRYEARGETRHAKELRQRAEKAAKAARGAKGRAADILSLVGESASMQSTPASSEVSP